MNLLKRKEKNTLQLIILSLLSLAFIGTELIAQEECRQESLAPFVPTPMEIVEKMLEVAEVNKNDIVYDLGCGDGRIVVMAAEKYGARGVGIDYDPERVAEAKELVKKKKVEKLVKIIHDDIRNVDYSSATVVTLYLLYTSNQLLKPYLEKYLKPGTRVVSHDFSMTGWEPKKTEFYFDEEGSEHTVYLYIISEQKQ